MLVRYHSTGLCHTDLFARDVFHQAEFPAAVYGHEGIGVVEAVGAGVTDFAEGDRVMASYASCGRCRTCLTGRPFNCVQFNDINFALARADGPTRPQRTGSRSGRASSVSPPSVRMRSSASATWPRCPSGWRPTTSTSWDPWVAACRPAPVRSSTCCGPGPPTPS
ncbi:alcohol dehydrogenase catalytic domain-containing protein [Pseudactinotalea sp. Z1732]|uniref:alcohol dehydrogenase catalytic domain-containing protein n=1 Tax=Pseudactinotalea sp. Z1732 TaxID=3413026 RepID=UPI003C7E65EA